MNKLMTRGEVAVMDCLFLAEANFGIGMEDVSWYWLLAWAILRGME